MAEVKARPGETVDSLLRRFKKAVEKSGILADFRKQEFYEKPSVKRKKKQIAARKRAAKRDKKLARAKSRGSHSNQNFKWNSDRTEKIPMRPPKKMSEKTKDFTKSFNKKHGSSKGPPNRTNNRKPYNKRG